jgi:hypothetical protein
MVNRSTSLNMNAWLGVIMCMNTEFVRLEICIKNLA